MNKKEKMDAFNNIESKLNLVVIDRWERKSWGKSKSYYIQFIHNDKDYCISMNDNVPTFVFSDDNDNYFYSGYDVEEMENKIREVLGIA